MKLLRRPAVAALFAMTVAAVLAAGCSSPSKPKPPPAPTGVLRLGYTTTLADAPVLAGLRLGYYATELGGVTLQAVPFPDTAAETRALQRGQLDAAYLDPMATVGLWQAGHGGIKIIAGVASGGAELVVKRGITSPKQLAGAVVVAPAASAQEVALDWWLRQHNVAKRGAGNVTMSGTALESALKSGRVAGASEPAPLDAQMTAAGGHVLVDEASLWPGGRFSTAVLAVTTGFLARHAAAVGLLLRGHIQSEQLAVTNRAAAEAAVGASSPWPARPCPSRPWPRVSRRCSSPSTRSPRRSGPKPSMPRRPACSARSTSLDGLFDLGPLNILLKSSGLRPVST